MGTLRIAINTVMNTKATEVPALILKGRRTTLLITDPSGSFHEVQGVTTEPSKQLKTQELHSLRWQHLSKQPREVIHIAGAERRGQKPSSFLVMAHLCVSRSGEG